MNSGIVPLSTGPMETHSRMTTAYPVHADHAAVLTSWKDIARYMGKGVRTVQRWEQDFGLPVRRPSGSDRKAILARPSDLDAWVAMRCVSRAQSGARNGNGNGHAKTAMNGRGAPLLPVTLARRSALHAEIKTARMLRESHRMLMDEISAALLELRSRIDSMSADR